MKKNEALNILLAHACCVSLNMCSKCPWDDTDDCKNTNFKDVIEEAVDVMMEDA